jgi:hypothetical protein
MHLLFAIFRWALMTLGALCLCSAAVVAWLLASACREPRRRLEREIIAHVSDLSDEELAEVLGRWAGSTGDQP